MKNDNPTIPPIIRAHFPPDHLISQDEIMKCHNSLQYNRNLQPHQKELIQEHMEKVERDGFQIHREVPEEDLAAWAWAEAFFIKEKVEVSDEG